MKIAVLGCGNSGCAHAAKLIQNGHSVNLVKTSSSIHSNNYKQIVNTGKIYCKDDIYEPSFEAVPHLITTDIKKGISGVDVVLVLTQSLQHRDLAKKVGPLLKPGQIVFLIPGNMGTAIFKKHTTNDNIVFVSGESTPYDARIYSPGKVQILFKNVRNAVAFENKDDEKLLPIIDSLFHTHKYLRTNVIESALHNPNLVVHTIGVIMSASRIEKQQGEFWMYRESFSHSIWNLINMLDHEKNMVIEAYNGKGLSYLDACKWRNEEDLSVDSISVFNSYAESGGPKGPDSLNTRFLYEDTPMGLCLLETLGRLKNIDTPITSSLITIACALKNVNYREHAYTPQELGF